MQCGKTSQLISMPLALCAHCIRTHFITVWPHVQKVHAQARRKFGLPAFPPAADNGLECHLCTNQCRISEGERGYCGVRQNLDGEFTKNGISLGNFSCYYDRLPTNCVADWVCPGGTDSGFPHCSYSPGIEYGYKNLAVFFQSCTFNCLFCQNWHYRESSLLSLFEKGPEAIANWVDDKTACICYFGGDPSSQIIYALQASQTARKERKEQILRICWETNGSMNSQYLKKAAQLSLVSGGCLKIDLKAWSDEIHSALCGVSNQRTLSNFKLMAKLHATRPDPPLLTASTLLIPGYVDESEVSQIAAFIAGLDKSIPYSLLGFYPHFLMNDLPPTSKKHAQRCRQAALDAGLEKVKIGNQHLLGSSY